MRIRIRDRNYHDHYLDVEPSDTIEILRQKITDKGIEYGNFSIWEYYREKMLEDNRTLDDYNIGKEAYIMLGYLYILNFEGEIYEKPGLGCYCCGGNGDLFGFLSSKTNIPRENLYLINGSEKIYDKNFDVRKYHLDEYFFSTDLNVGIKIKFKGKVFFVYPQKESDFEDLFELIAIRIYNKFYNKFYYYDKEKDKRIERIKAMLYRTDYDLEYNDNDDEDLSEIENIKEINFDKKSSNEDKKE